MVWFCVLKLYKYIIKGNILVLFKYWFKIINDCKIFYVGKKKLVLLFIILWKFIDFIFICKKKNIYCK